jgi:hypothetical protein
MALAAIILSGVAIAISIGSLVFTWRADRRAGRAEKRADRAEQQAERAGDVAELERIGEIVDRLAAAVEASATDPHAPRRVAAERVRLSEAIAASDFDLPATSVYADRADAGLLPAAKGELEEAIGLARRGER